MRKIVMTGMALSLILAARTCKQDREGVDLTGKRQYSAPVIEISPLAQGGGQWKIVAPNVVPEAVHDAVMVIVTAPGAERVQILSRPEGVEEYHLELQTLATPVDRESGRFLTRLILTPDFAGQMWAEAVYPGGARKRTETIMLAVDVAGAGTPAPPDVVGGSVGTDESARSDRLTGWGIRKTRLIAGNPDIRITVNAPAFQLTLWQNGKEVRAYYIGIGQRKFPLPIGERGATAIIFNPHWAPASGAWVSHGNNVSSGERSRSNDPPPSIGPSLGPLLGRIKISLGAGYMIRETARADDIGRAVSHGSILMLRADLLDLAEKIVAARDPSLEKSGCSRLGDRQERFAATLDPPVLVDINYDLQVVENSMLHVYPDAYERGAFALDSLRAELQSAGVAARALGDDSLRRILDQVGADTQFVIKVSDVRSGSLRRGRKLPLIDNPVGRGKEIAAGLRR
jgi:hypothetical protein